MSVCWRSPVSSSSRSSSSSFRSRASSMSRSSTSAGSSTEKTRNSPVVVVHLDGRVPRRARRLLVRGEQRVLERGDERALLDSLVALDLANGVDDLLAHDTPSSIRLARTISAYGMSVSAPSDAATVTLCSSAATTSPCSFSPTDPELDPAADRRLEVLSRAQRAVDARRGDLDGVLAQVVAQDVGDARAQLVVDAVRMVDVDAEARRRQELDGEDVDARHIVLDLRDDLSLQLALLLECRGHVSACLS